MKFGPELNAFTSFDETVFMIDVPTDNSRTLEKGIQILEEWAHNDNLEDQDIDKERGVIVEEWRIRRGAMARIYDKLDTILYKNSQYALRNTIGDMEIVKNCPHDVLRKFYKDWYRPDLMAVIAVGDFDSTWMEKTVKDHFSELSNPPKERERKIYSLPDNDQTLYAIASDSEATQTSIGLYFKMDVEKEKTLEDYKKSIVEDLYNAMLNTRLKELSQKADPPFIYAYSGNGRFIRTKDVYYLGGIVKGNGIQRGFEAILTEADRVKRFGFTHSELEREKKNMLSSLEQAYNERDKTESKNIINQYVNYFLYGNPAPGIEFKYEMARKQLPTITLEEVNNLSAKFMPLKNRIVLITAPDKKDIILPCKKELAAILEKVNDEKLAAYEDKVSDQPLMENIPEGSKVISEKEIPDFKVTEWKLANGVTVVLKPTNFKNDEINFQAFGPGGTSLVTNEDYIPASTASSIVSLSGIGNFDQISLQKKLAGKVVRVYPYINELSEGLSGSCSVKDIESLFQLIYLHINAVRNDSSAFLSYRSRMKDNIANRNLSPDAAFQDTLSLTLAQYNPRRYPWTPETLDKMDLDKSLNIYKHLFSDASRFTFVFVGNFDTANIKPFVETYLGSLPSTNNKESWKDLNIYPPKGVISKEVKKGIEQKSTVNLTFTGPFDYDYQKIYDLKSTVAVLDIKLREIICQDKGGTYGVGVYPDIQKIPHPGYSITIQFGCSPARVNELTEDVLQTIDSLKNVPVDDIYINKIKEIQKRETETNLKDNKFWLNKLYDYYFNNLDLSQFMKDIDRTEKFSKETVMNIAKQYFDLNNYVKVVLYP
jgi:zinc protease